MLSEEISPCVNHNDDSDLNAIEMADVESSLDDDTGLRLVPGTTHDSRIAMHKPDSQARPRSKLKTTMIDIRDTELVSPIATKKTR